MKNRSILWWSGTLLLILQATAGAFLLWRASQPQFTTIEVAVVVTTMIASNAAIIFVSNRIHESMMMRSIDATRRFGRGHLHERVQPAAFADHNKLGEALNRMASRLDGRMQDMRTHQLEQQVIMESIAAAIIAVDQEHHILNSNCSL